MTLYEVVKYLESIALTQPNVNYAGEGNIYAVFDTKPDLEYAGFFITQNTHKREKDFDYFNLNLFYIDRILPDMESNVLQIQSIGHDILQNIIDTFCYNLDTEINLAINYQPFVQKFHDECAGIYATVEFIVPADIICPEEFKED